VTVEETGAHAGREVDRLAPEVLEQERHAAEGAVRQPGGDRRTSDRLLHVDDGSDGPVGGDHPLQRHVEQLVGCGLTTAHERSETQTVEVVVLLESHGTHRVTGPVQ
jgi:hypothetical protein